MRAETHYWTGKPVLQEIRGILETKNDFLFTGPLAPAKGPETLAVSLDKASRAFEPMMALCKRGTRIPAITFAESSELARHTQEHGPKPQDVPDHYQYRTTMKWPSPSFTVPIR